MRSLDEAIAAAREAAADMAVRESFYGVAKLIRTGEEAWTASAIDSFAADYCEALAKAQQWKQLAEDTPAAMRRELAAKDAEIDRLKAAAIPDGPPTPEQALRLAHVFWPKHKIVCVAKNRHGITRGYEKRPKYTNDIWASGGWFASLGSNVAWPANLLASGCIYPAPEKPLAVGDWVVWRTGTTLGQIMAVSEKSAWVKWGKDDHYNTWPIKDMRRAIPDEIKETNDED